MSSPVSAQPPLLVVHCLPDGQRPELAIMGRDLGGPGTLVQIADMEANHLGPAVITGRQPIQIPANAAGCTDDRCDRWAQRAGYPSFVALVRDIAYTRDNGGWEGYAYTWRLDGIANA